MAIKITTPNGGSDSLDFGCAQTPNVAAVTGTEVSSGEGKLELKTTTGGTSATKATVLANGNVGIGTAAPLAKNHTLGAGTAVVASGSDGRAEAIIEGANIPLTNSYGNLNIISNTSQAADTGGQIAFGGKHTDSNNAYGTWAVIKGAKENATSANIASYLAFSTRANGGGNTEKLRITSAGNVGIGCTPESDSILELESGSPGPRLRLTNTSGSGDSWKIHSSNTGALNFLDDGNDTTLSLYDDGRGVSSFTAKAWVNFNGTGTIAIDDSHNVSSLTDNAAGQYIVNLSNALTGNDTGAPVASSMSGTGEGSSGSPISCALRNSTGISVTSGTGGSSPSYSTHADISPIHVILFGD